MFNIDLDWADEADDDDKGRAWPQPPSYRPTLSLNGVPLHVYAIQVDAPTEGWMRATNPIYQDDVDAVSALDSDQLLQTVELPGLQGEWLLVLHPYGR